ncbi:MAG TPA: DUF2804 domain-containing protein [Phycicoccus sp.]
MAERELHEPVALVGPDGRLAADAVGWARRPLVDTSGIDGRRSWGRNKRWEYWNVLTPTHVLALTVSSLDYAAVLEVWVLDRATLQAVERSVTAVPARGVTLPARLGAGPARGRAKDLSVDVEEVPGGTRLRASITGASFDVLARRPDGHECLAVVVPWSRRRFQYTVKDVARPAEGSVTVGGRTHDVPAGESWATLDHGRGRWPYDVRWNWGAGAGRCGDRVVGLQLGGRWTVGTGMTENAVVVDGRVHKVGEELAWDFDPSDYLAPWRVRGGGLDLVLTPFHDRVARTQLGVVAGRTDQCFGHWAGTVRVGGEELEVDGLAGWAEDVHNRW